MKKKILNYRTGSTLLVITGAERKSMDEFTEHAEGKKNTNDLCTGEISSSEVQRFISKRGSKKLVCRWQNRQMEVIAK